MTVEEIFKGTAARLLAEQDRLEQGRMFGSLALKTAGKVFAICTRGSVVLKLPTVRVDGLIESGAGQRFDPGHGRLMKEWVSLMPADETACETLVREALAFVTGGVGGG